jgi:hypothetical protein
MESKSNIAFLQQTIDVWQSYSKEKLSLEDAQEIIENVTGFFKLLIRWDAQQAPERLGEGEEGFPDPPSASLD